MVLSPAFLQARKPKHREVKQPPPRHTAKRGRLVICSSSCWWGRSSCPRVMGMVKHMTPATGQMGQTGVYLSCILPTGGGQYLPCRAHRALRTEWSGEAWGDGLCRNERARWPQVSEGGRAGRELTPLLRVKQGPHGKKCCFSGGPFLLERRGRAFCGLAIRSPPDFIRYQGSTEWTPSPNSSPDTQWSSGDGDPGIWV